MTPLLLLAPIGLPLAASLGYAVFGWRTGTAWAGVLTTALLAADAVGLAVTVTHNGPLWILGGLLRAGLQLPDRC